MTDELEIVTVPRQLYYHDDELVFEAPGLPVKATGKIMEGYGK